MIAAPSDSIITSAKSARISAQAIQHNSRLDACLETHKTNEDHFFLLI